MNLIDTHCHINYPEHFPDVDAAIVQAQHQGVSRLMIVGTELESAKRAIEIAERHEGVYAILGMHPCSTEGYTRSKLTELEPLMSHPKFVALGETGLDFHWQTPHDDQYASLRDHLNLAQAKGLRVVFHARNATTALLDELEKRPQMRYLFHCWSGTMDDLKRAIALDAHFGIDGPVTYPKSDDLREQVAAMPRDRILLETDSPFMAPAPFRGKPNRPEYVRYVCEAVAKTLEIDTDACAELTTGNAVRFFGI